MISGLDQNVHLGFYGYYDLTFADMHRDDVDMALSLTAV